MENAPKYITTALLDLPSKSAVAFRKETFPYRLCEKALISLLYLANRKILNMRNPEILASKNEMTYA